MYNMVNKSQPMPSSLACVVKATFPGTEDECSNSGIFVSPGEGIIVTHGSILSEVCRINEGLLSKIKSGQHITSENFQSCSFYVLVDSCWKASHLFSTHSPMLVRGNEEHQVKTKEAVDSSFALEKCKFIGAFRNLEFHKTVTKVMPQDNWTFSNTIQEDSMAASNEKDNVSKSEDLDNQITLELLSYFVILSCEPMIYYKPHSSLPELSISYSLAYSPKDIPNCQIGSVAEIVSTPFGGLNPTVFFNSYSRGIISNVAGTNNCWVLTDARSIPGSEGAPLFIMKSQNERYLAGMLVASLCWKNKEWIGFSLACGIDSIWNTLNSNIVQATHGLNWKLPGNFDQAYNIEKGYGNKELAVSMPRVVLIKVGRVWGSGFVIDHQKGLILTCSHVIKDAAPPDPAIYVQALNKSLLYKATVVYRQYSEQIDPFDLAILRCHKAVAHLSQSKPAMIVSSFIGQRVWVCGHAAFNTELGLKPSVSSGVVSKVIKVRDQDVMVQSTCAVHAGASGGPLLDYDGNLVGIVVCNTVDKGSSSTYPHINFSVPATTFWPSIQQFIKTRDVSCMESLKVNDPIVKKLWALDSTIESAYSVKSKL